VTNDGSVNNSKKVRGADHERRPAMGGLLTREEAAAFLGVSMSSMAHWSCHGQGPAKMLIGRRSYYSVGALHEYLISRSGVSRGR
jgi:hypothetical protein